MADNVPTLPWGENSRLKSFKELCNMARWLDYRQGVDGVVNRLLNDWTSGAIGEAEIKLKLCCAALDLLGYQETLLKTLCDILSIERLAEWRQSKRQDRADPVPPSAGGLPEDQTDGETGIYTAPAGVK